MKNKHIVTRNTTLNALKLQLLSIQKKIAGWLNNKCHNLSSTALMAMLFTFCSLCATLLIMLIIGKL